MTRPATGVSEAEGSLGGFRFGMSEETNGDLGMSSPYSLSVLSSRSLTNRHGEWFYDLANSLSEKRERTNERTKSVRTLPCVPTDRPLSQGRTCTPSPPPRRSPSLAPGACLLLSPFAISSEVFRWIYERERERESQNYDRLDHRQPPSCRFLYSGGAFYTK